MLLCIKILPDQYILQSFLKDTKEVKEKTVEK